MLRSLTTFIGRANELAAVCALLTRDDVQLVTITGPGGVGKTRLARRAAEELGAGYHGVWLVSLESCQDPARVPTIIAGTIGIPPGTTQTAELELVTFLTSQRSLLVIDNFEHMLDAGPFVATLLSACPHLTVLATSRTALRLSGEHLYPLRPLPVPGNGASHSLDALARNDAVALFVSRAQASSVDFALATDNAPAVVAICQRLDGLPLAIELAASRIGILPLPLLLERLEPRLALLGNGPRDAPARQQTMSGTIAWSYDLLSANQQVLFRQLGAFVGGFTMDAAVSVSGRPADQVVDELMSLVANSLVSLGSGSRGMPRYTLLETIREFALGQLRACDEEQPVRRSHAEYFTTLAEALIPLYDCPDLPITVDRINDELGNCREAMEWALAASEDALAVRLSGAIWRVWFYPQSTGERPWLNRLIEGREWLERALLKRNGLPVEWLTESMMGAGYLAFLHGDLDRGHELGEELFARSQAGAYPYGAYWAHILLASVCGARGQASHARRHFSQAIDIAQGIRDPHNQRAFALMQLAELEVQASNPEEAIRRFSEAMEINRQSRNPCITSHCCRSIGVLSVDAGDHAKAVPLLRRGIVMDIDLTQMVCVTESLVSLAQSAVGLGHQDLAARLLSAAQRLPFLPATQSQFEALRASIAAEAAGHDVESGWEAGSQMAWDDVMADIDVLEALAGHLTEVATPLPRQTSHGLSHRELEVIGLLAEGRTNRGIAETLCLSKRTIDNHVLHILTKLQLESRTAVATYAVRNGLA
jgi:predicted ATPase/DNA-binding CsgD family transcriptional regulator